MVTFLGKDFIFYFLSYLIGSIPFGFLFSKFFAKKDVLKVGWRKTSGSNVFFHVSKTLGILTGIFDLLKGSLVVFLARYFQLSPFSQVLCGIFAIVGHNWSIYLKFAGGRGVGTFLGGLIFFDPRLLFFAVIPTVIFLFLLNSPLATIFLFLFCLIFSLYLQNQTVFLFSLFSLFPIFLKRLSPISEISFRNPNLIKNRLLYDRNEFVITRIEKWLSRR